MKNALIKLIFGESIIRDYSSVSIAGEIREHVYLQSKHTIIDISRNQFLLSLDPVVMGVWVEKEKDILALNKNTVFKIFFDDDKVDDGNIKQHAVAIAELNLFDKIEESDGTLFLLRMKKSEISHIHFLKILLLYYKFYRKPGLSFSQFKSLVTAHSYPRRVRVISFRDGDYYNIFPMDLLGDISGSKRFVFGLRHSNHSLTKIIQAKKIVVSEFSSSYKSIVYQLGKHHTSQPLAMDSLPFKTRQTDHFNFYIPGWVESYKEINIVKNINLGSHMLLWGESVNEKKLMEDSPHLFHIPFLLYLHQKNAGYGYKQA